MANQITDVVGRGRSFTVLPSAARTATPDTFEYEGAGRFASGVIVVVDVTAVTATGSLTVKIQGVDRLSGKTWDILASAAINAVSTVVLRVHPDMTAALNVAAADMLPPVFRVAVTAANSVSMTYSVSAHLVN